MDNVIEKTKNLIEVFEESDLIKNLDHYKKIVLDKPLLKKLNTLKINSYEEYKEYMKYYNELFYYVMDINKRFKKYTDVRGCHK